MSIQTIPNCQRFSYNDKELAQESTVVQRDVDVDVEMSQDGKDPALPVHNMRSTSSQCHLLGQDPQIGQWSHFLAGRPCVLHFQSANTMPPASDHCYCHGL
eukprot:2520848-Amphidinium_carterae.1